nr:MAG TPA_asm: hypothetical protein [Caudoviricetes sp.]
MPTIVSKNRADAARIASKLLRAAGAEAHLVRTVTAGRTLAFEVPDSVYAKYQAGEGDKGEVEQAASQGTEQPAASTDNGTADADQAVDATEQAEADKAAAAEQVEAAKNAEGDDGAPDRNDSTAAWAEYMHDRFGIDTDGMKRAELIAEYDARTGAADDGAGE